MVLWNFFLIFLLYALGFVHNNNGNDDYFLYRKIRITKYSDGLVQAITHLHKSKYLFGKHSHSERRCLML